MNAKKFLTSARAGLGVCLLALLAGCEDFPAWTSAAKVPTFAQTQTALGRMDHYVYFPSYAIYYNTTKRQYVYVDRYVWVIEDNPPSDVTVEMLRNSISVAMGFHDAPQRHHAEVVQRYPKDGVRPEVALASSP